MAYEHIVLKSAEGDILESIEQGTWTPDLAERVARPWIYASEGLMHEEEAWYLDHPEGTVESGYRVTAHVIDPVSPAVSGDADPISASLFETIASLDDSAEIDVLLQLAGWSAPALPWVPHFTAVSSEQYEAAVSAKRAAAEERLATFGAASEALVGAVGDAGGQVTGALAGGGWVVARIPAAAVAPLAARGDVRRIVIDSRLDDGTHTGDPVPLDDLRALTGAQPYLAAGYDGTLCGVLCGPGNVIGIHETEGYQDGACFQGQSGCSTARLRSRFDCDAGGCTELGAPGFPTAQEGHHGTIVTSIAFADYLGGQATGWESWIAPGLSNWEDPATGFATGARLDYFRVEPSLSGGSVAYDCAHGVGPAECAMIDVMNESNGNEVGLCNVASHLPIESALEDAWDAGVLPVVITHNDNTYPTMDSCKVRSPADMPKAFAVGAVDPEFADPTFDYHSWPYAHYSNRGGATVTAGGNVYLSTMSMVDLVASGRPGYVTDADAPFGTISVGGPHGGGPYFTPISGTSFAGPQVAGAAVLVKNRHQQLNQAWITTPGRLHAVMLTMGDRATLGTAGATVPSCINAAGDQILCGADRYYGLGRLTLRMHPSFWFLTMPWTAASTASRSYMLWRSPLPASRRLVKCAMQQAEDMVDPDRNDISLIGITLQIRSPNAQGACEKDVGTIWHTVSDATADDKHMVAATDAEVSLAGRCVQVTLTKNVISTAGSITTHTYCVNDDQLDNE